jgi:hypothetical protein
MIKIKEKQKLESNLVSSVLFTVEQTRESMEQLDLHGGTS